MPPCGVCRSPVPSVYSINYKRKKNQKKYQGRVWRMGHTEDRACRERAESELFRE